MIPEQRQNEYNPILFSSKYRSFNNVSSLNAVYPWITNSTDNDHKLINCLEEMYRCPENQAWTNQGTN